MNERAVLTLLQVIVFARDYQFIPNQGALLTSRTSFLDSSIPIPKQRLPLLWSSELFLQYLQQMSAAEAAIHDQNPVEYIIPFAQMSLVNTHYLMDLWAQKVEPHKGTAAENLEIRYDEQTETVNALRQNLEALESFTTNTSSRRWKNLLPDHERILQQGERQISMLAQKMSYRASMASLRESQMAIEQARTGIQQNERVKRLT